MGWLVGVVVRHSQHVQKTESLFYTFFSLNESITQIKVQLFWHSFFSHPSFVYFSFSDKMPLHTQCSKSYIKQFFSNHLYKAKNTDIKSCSFSVFIRNFREVTHCSTNSKNSFSKRLLKIGLVKEVTYLTVRICFAIYIFSISVLEQQH